MATVEYAWGSTHYARRRIREARHQSGCRAGKDRAPTCGGAFRCAKCKSLAGWCRGASDARPDWCDSCWYRADRMRTKTKETP
jgi:hypothetical protein